MRNRATLFLAALSMVAVAVGCSSTQKDQALATDIKAKMFSDPQVNGTSIDVAVKNGEVTLSGDVPHAPPPPSQPKHVEIPSGTTVRVQMIDGVDSSVNRAGEVFRASLAVPLVVDNQVVVPVGTDVYVKLANAKSAGHLTGQSTLALELA